MREIAPGVAVVPTLIANAFLVGDNASWVLVDACTPGNESRIQRATERRFGRGSQPCAIVLTHGHFDHAVSAGPLADAWGGPIYAHSLGLPYLTGRSHYPPFDLRLDSSLGLRSFSQPAPSKSGRKRQLAEEGQCL